MADLKLSNVQKRFGAAEVIPGADLEIVSGEFVVFVGPSGCGKSTLLRMVAGLEDLSGGTIHIDGEDVSTRDPSDRGIAMVFQSYALYPHYTVRGNLGFGLKIARTPKEEIDRRVDEAARVLELTPYLDRKPAALSGGQRQRVAIGRAIVREPKVFLFDEPLSNLDAELRVQMRVEIAKLHKQLGVTMIYVTHDQVEAMTLADRIVVLRAGRIEQHGSPISLYDDPDTLFVAGFIGSPSMNFLKATVTEANGRDVTVTLDDFEKLSITVPCRSGNTAIGDPVTFGVRPEHFIAPTDASVVLAARIDVVEQLGGVSYIYADGDDGARVIVESKGHYRAEGDTVTCGIDPATCFLFDRNETRI